MEPFNAIARELIGRFAFFCLVNVIRFCEIQKIEKSMPYIISHKCRKRLLLQTKTNSNSSNSSNSSSGEQQQRR